jgi:hypothetical protein
MTCNAANICEMDIPFSATKITGLARPTLLVSIDILNYAYQ